MPKPEAINTTNTIAFLASILPKAREQKRIDNAFCSS